MARLLYFFCVGTGKIPSLTQKKKNSLAFITMDTNMFEQLHKHCYSFHGSLFLVWLECTYISDASIIG